MENLTTTIKTPFDFGGILSGISGIANTVYGLFTNKRDFDYQKALQQQIFEREDTAVQRRMSDLEAAGINPNLAAGSAAAAGSTVGRSNTQGINFGAALDTYAAMNQIKAQQQELKILKSQAREAYSKANMQELNDEFDSLWLNYLKNGETNNNRLNAYFKFLYDNQKNTSEMIQKQNNWFNTNQVFNAIGNATGSIKDVGSLFKPNFMNRR